MVLHAHIFYTYAHTNTKTDVFNVGDAATNVVVVVDVVVAPSLINDSVVVVVASDDDVDVEVAHVTIVASTAPYVVADVIVIAATYIC